MYLTSRSNTSFPTKKNHLNNNGIKKVSYVNKRGMKDDASTVVEDINNSFLNSMETFDGFLDGSGAGGASHSMNGEKSGDVGSFRDGGGGGTVGTGISFGVGRHGGIVRSSREIVPSFVSKTS